ncbi:MAG: hypothetical protein Q8865_06795 [Bacillota bacterium]|nr:hypothetical protein [Bacillota bacterium]
MYRRRNERTEAEETGAISCAVKIAGTNVQLTGQKILLLDDCGQCVARRCTDETGTARFSCLREGSYTCIFCDNKRTVDVFPNRVTAVDFFTNNTHCQCDNNTCNNNSEGIIPDDFFDRFIIQEP